MASLEKAFDFAMDLEGGGVVHTVEGDPGGTTKWGISKRAHPELDIASLTREEAIEVYREEYWNPRRLGSLISQVMADEVFEFTINADPKFSSRGKAIRCAQAAANEVFEAVGDSERLAEDGVMGPNTLRRLNDVAELGPLAVLAWDARFNIHQLARYRELRRDLVRRFLLGWSRRVIV